MKRIVSMPASAAWVLGLAALGVAILGAALPLEAQPVPEVGEALPEETRAVLSRVTGERLGAPEKHYYRSNEWRQDLLRPHLEGPDRNGLGGAFIGVGSDQNFTMAAMAKARLLFLVDYDPRIPWIHAIYKVLLEDAETPDALLALFSEEREREVKALLEAGLAEHPRSEQIVRHWLRRRSAWHAYLRRVSRLQRDGQPFSWLSDPDLYAHTRALFREGRVVSLVGDLTQDGAFHSVAEACNTLEVPVRVLYFSNAEQFFPYTDAFVENMRRFVAGDAIVLRTIRHRRIRIAEQGRWHYLVQDLSDFVERLDTGYYRRSFALTADLLAAGPPHLGADGLSTMTQDTPRTVASRAQADR